jgi:hypothetical protein
VAAAEALGEFGEAAASRCDVLAAIYEIYLTDQDLAERAPIPWDRQGLRIFRRGDGFTVRTIAELTRPTRA